MPRHSSEIRICLLGDLRLGFGGKPLKLPTRQTRLLFAYLALNAKPVRREKLADLFWGGRAAAEPVFRDYDDARADDADIEKSARASLRTALYSLRSQLGNDVLLDENDTVRLNPARHLWIDAVEFRTQVEEFLAAPPGSSVRADLDLYHGEFLAGVDDDPDEQWITPEREALRELYRDALLRMAQVARSAGEYDNAIDYAERVLALEAYNEEAYQHLMLSYFMLGQKSVALDLYRKLEETLRNEFGHSEEGQPSPETRKLYHDIKRAKSRSAATFAALTNLPNPLTRFIARDQETEAVRRMIEPPGAAKRSGAAGAQPVRLVTLTGPGGCGKTRLALEVATRLLGHCPDGVWWVELEALSREQDLVPQAVAKVLGVWEQSDRALPDVLVAFLRGKQLLLVLDNCEHLLGGVARLCERLLTDCPRLRILTTSREILRLPGERYFYVPSFTVPPEQAGMEPAMMKQYEAVQFFLDRCAVEKPGFALTEENAPSVAEICRRLDGIPLAIELAAARVKLGVDHIAGHLHERFALLTRGPRGVPRHQTLRAAIDWSYDLLNASEQQLLNQLGVFAAWFTLGAVEAVCGEGEPEDPVRDRLESLTDKSLVMLEMELSGKVRYRLLDTIREYAREKLQKSKVEADAAFARMGKYYLQFACQNQNDFIKLEQEWESVTAGLRVMHRQQMWEEVIQFGHALTPTCFARGFYAQARQFYPWVCQAAERLEEQEAYIESMLSWGQAYIEQGFYAEAEDILSRLLRICREADDRGGIAGAQLFLARIDVERSNNDEAREHLDECRAIHEQRGDHLGLAAALNVQSRMEYRFLRYDQAEKLALEALDLLQPLPPSPQAIIALRMLAQIARVKKDLARAEQYCRQAIEICERLGDRGEMAAVLFALGQVRQSSGDLVSARDLLEKAAPLMKQSGDVKSEAHILDFLGSVYLDLGEKELAYASGKQSLALLRPLGDDTSIIFASVRFGKTLCRMNRVQEACQLWAEALPTADRLNHPWAAELKGLIEKYCS